MDDRRAIRSALGDDPSNVAAIEAFVLGLAERIDELQDCEAEGAFSRLAERASELALDAAKAGFDPLAEWAELVRRAGAERNGQDARKALLELTELAYRVRMGHRGAV
jgi:hypothetical protein